MDLFLSYHTFALSFVCVCYFDYGNIGETFSRGVANSFCFYLRLFDYEPWNHIPQVIEGGTCNDHLHF